MERRDSNRVNMIETVIEYCDKNAGVTSGIPAFAVVLGKVKAKKSEVNVLNETRSSVGVTKDTNLVRQRMTALALKCGNATSAYAYSIRNHTLAGVVDVTEDDLNQMTKEDVHTACKRIHDAAQTHIAEVVNWGITVGDVNNLEAAINLYKESMADPRLAIVSRGQATARIKSNVREVIDELLKKQLDKMVNTLKIEHYNFWVGYRMARNIIALGVTHAKVHGAVRDVNDFPLEGVRFTICEAGTQKVVKEVLSGAKGRFNASPMPTGSFDFVWALEGFELKTESNVWIGLGKELKRRVVMKRI